jgi:hypothetical protein
MFENNRFRDRKREYYFLEGMTFPAETVIVKKSPPNILYHQINGTNCSWRFDRLKFGDAALYQHPHSEVAQSIPVEVERCQGVEVQ